jgi:NAD(P)-dependent dehydrogenase (short-subunit alcohol dehydrogenase family)
MDIPYRSALIIGVGPGIGASLARMLRASGVAVVITARRVEPLLPLAVEIGAIALAVDASKPADIALLFAEVETRIGAPEIVIYNASAYLRGPIADLDPGKVKNALEVTALGAFYAIQQAARKMIPEGRGTILLTGATAGVKGFALSAPFAMGKFALRGLAQSAARELAPKGIHVAHIVIDGSVRPTSEKDPRDGSIDADAVARSYADLLRQHRSAWSWELEIRPWIEPF